VRRRISATVAVALLGTALSGCTVAGATDSSTIQVVVGYQSKTINTVTAGTLLRSRGYFEKRLDALGRKDGKKYQVVWQDYATGAPITAQMVAGKVDIGSMGDYPLLINGSRTAGLGDDRSELVSVTGYNMLGGLNDIVVRPGSSIGSLADLKGQKVSASVGSAGDGTLVQALTKAGMDPAKDVTTENQQPSVGASALTSGSVAAYAQFVAWPGLLVYKNQARMLYDGSALKQPTFHGVVVRHSFATQYPAVLDAFLKAQLDATNYLHRHPLAAAESVAKATGLPAEVVYLYNGPDGIATFDTTLKPALTAALKKDVPYLKSIGEFSGFDLSRFVDPGPLQKAYGSGYASAVADTSNPAAITGTDPVCRKKVSDPATAGEIWLRGSDTTQPAATPTCLLRGIAAAQRDGKKVRAAYVPDATTGTRWFADKAVWVADPSAAADSRYQPFTTRSGADAFVHAHPGAHVISYAAAVAAA
jgi:sulfonate transport system substrate-binding protein